MNLWESDFWQTAKTKIEVHTTAEPTQRHLVTPAALLNRKLPLSHS
jgi:hypothetical protein